jgi:two-component system, NtrC family, sensor kinase
VLRKLSLQVKIIILVTSVTVFMMSVIVAFDSYSLDKSVEETYISQLVGITTAINGRYEESHSVKDVQQIFDYIEYKNNNVLQLTLYGKTDILASTDRMLIGRPTRTNLLQELKEKKTLVDHVQGERGIPLVLLTAPLKEDGITIGAIELLLNISDKTELVHDRIQLIVIVGLFSTILLLIILWLIIRKHLILPLLKIRKAAISVKHDEEYKEIELNASLEINEVADAFNNMVLNLESRYHDLEQALETIQQTQKRLVESEKMGALGNLVAGVSHEINTPIGIGVTASSYLELKSSEFNEKYQQNKVKRSELEEYLKTVSETSGMIQTNLQRASELISSFKQIAVDQSYETNRKFYIKEYIEEVLKSLQPNLKKTRHQVMILGEDGIEVDSEPGAFSQIITNLIMNSLIHAFDEEKEGKITINVMKKEKDTLIHYADDGKGMTEDIRKHIFDPFFTTNRGGGGTGLGMNIVYNLVTQKLGGTIECNSEAGIGTTFLIHVPIKREGSNDV